MSSVKKFIQKQQERRSSGGGGSRTDFFRKPRRGEKAMTIVGRLFPVKDDDGDEVPAFAYMQHGYGKSTEICPKTFDPDAYCETCEESRIAYQAEDRDLGGSLRAKTKYWFGFVPKMSQFEEKLHILELPYSFVQSIWAMCAFKGGWGSPEIDLEDTDCVKALEEGVDKVYGEKGYDLIFTIDPNASPQKMYRGGKLATRATKCSPKDYEPQNFEDIFRRVKKLNDDGGPKTTEAKAPPPDFDKMTVKELKEYAKRMEIPIPKSYKKPQIVKCLKEVS